MSFNSIKDKGVAAWKEKRRDEILLCDCGDFADRVSDHDDCDLEELIANARKSSRLTTNQGQFLNDLEAKYDEYGGEMYFSRRQHRHLQVLASKGREALGNQEDSNGGEA